MRLLIIGGTRFLGRALVEVAKTRGHQITLFTRGQSNPDLFPEVEHLRGDRAESLEPLQGRTWDAVIDTCGYLPRDVERSAQLLAPAVGHYTFISTLSVYADNSSIGQDESGPLGTLSAEEVAQVTTVKQITGDNYGPLKVLCEQAAEQAMPGRVLCPRPGYIVGPHDPSDRFTYWVARTARGGEMLAPAPPEAPVQVIDVRDLAEWNLALVEAGTTGYFSATGPETPLRWDTLLETCREVSGSDARFTWVDADFLNAQMEQPWAELPLWVGNGPDVAGFHTYDCRRAIATGLTFRPLVETVHDTLAWHHTRPTDLVPRAGMAPEREQTLLQTWHQRVSPEG